MDMPSSRLLWPALLAILVLVLPGQGSAALVRWYFSGRVVQVTGAPGGSNPAKIASLAGLGVVPDAAITGSFAFESTTPDTAPADGAVGEYLGAITDLQVSTGTYETTTGPIGAQTNAIVVATDAAPFGPALFANSSGSDSPPIAANDLLFVLDLSGGALPIASDALPVTPPDPALAGSITFALVSEAEYVIELELQSLSATAPAQVSTLPRSGAALLVLALALALQTGRMPRFFAGSGSSGRAR